MVLIGEGSAAAGDVLERMYRDMVENEPAVGPAHTSHARPRTPQAECPTWRCLVLRANERRFLQVRRMSPASAEITKLAINCFITTKVCNTRSEAPLV